MIVDVALDVTGVGGSTTLTRLLTGGVFGGVIPFHIIPAAQQAVHELQTGYQPLLRPESKKGPLHA
jgi:hypothetical protein